MLTMGEGFSGIGGWSEAAKMAGGITPIWHFENDPNKIKFYEHRHPGVPNLGDVRHIITPPHMLTSSPSPFHALTSRLWEKVQELKEAIAECGLKRKEFLGWYDPDTSSLKTAQFLIFEDSTGFLNRLPRSGMMQNGHVYRAQISGFSNCVKGYIVLPTPIKGDSRPGAKGRFLGALMKDRVGLALRSYFRDGPEDPTYLNPEITEVLMTFPVGYTDLKVQEMPSYP